METVVAIFFMGFGGYMLLWTEAWIRRTHESNGRLGAWIDRTAYGRWFARIEEPFTRVFGVLFIVIGIAILVGLFPTDG